MGPKEKMKMKPGVSEGSSLLPRFLLLWSEHAGDVKKKSAEWRRRDVRPVLRN